MWKKAFKALKKDMTCRDFQYEEGNTYELPEGQSAELCERGFHACERAADTLRYYDAADCVIHEVEVDDVDRQRGNDTKIASGKIRIGARLNIAQLVQATFAYNKEHCTEEHTDPKQASAGAYGAASAGFRGAASAGAYGAASAGFRGAASAGEYGAAVSRGSAEVGANGIAAVRGNGVKVRGGLGAVLVIAEEDRDDYNIAAWKAVVVDGEIIKADTWYTLKGGKLVEVTGDGE